MVTLENKIIKEEINENKYTKEEIDFAINYLNTFLIKLNNLTVKDNGEERNLNELEKFICIYNFVTKRNYKNIKDFSQDIIGAINHNCFVCMSFSKMIKILCDEANICCFIKYCITKKTGAHANNEVIIHDKNDRKHLLHVDATIDCLNYENMYQDNNNITRINALLLTEDDINKFRNPIDYESITNMIYIYLVKKIKFNELFKLNDKDKILIDSFYCSYEDIILNKMENLIEGLDEFIKYLDYEYIGDKMEIKDICNNYKNITEIYNNMLSPINFNEMLEALIHIEESLIIYEQPGNIDSLQKAKEIVLKKLQLSLEFQLKAFNNTNGKSFMFTLTNNILNNKIN